MRDEWKETDTPMTQKRHDHSCLMLNEYEVMVVGGSDGSNYLKSSEIFNLKEKTWNRGPDLETPLEFAQFLKCNSYHVRIYFFFRFYGVNGPSQDYFI